MQTIKLRVDDQIYENIMFLLKNLKHSGLEILENSKKHSVKTNKDQIKKLFESKDIELFASIDDPLEWQKKARAEW